MFGVLVAEYTEEIFIKWTMRNKSIEYTKSTLHFVLSSILSQFKLGSLIMRQDPNIIRTNHELENVKRFIIKIDLCGLVCITWSFLLFLFRNLCTPQTDIMYCNEFTDLVSNTGYLSCDIERRTMTLSRDAFNLICITQIWLEIVAWWWRWWRNLYKNTIKRGKGWHIKK